MHFPLIVVEKVRSVLGGRLLLYRLGSDDLAPNGIQIEESIEFAKRLEQVGVDILDVSGGMCGAMPKQLKRVAGYFLPKQQKSKKP